MKGEVMSWFKQGFGRFVEFFRGASTLLTSEQKWFGAAPEIGFENMWKVYIAQPAVRTSIEFRADQITGSGFYTSMNADYKETLDGKTAKEHIDEFNKAIELDELLQASARLLVGFGNCFWWLRDIENPQVDLIPIFHVKKILFNKNFEASALQLSWNVKPKQIPWDEIVAMRLPPYDRGGFGLGVLQTLCKSLAAPGAAETRPSFASIIADLQTAMIKQFIKWGAPNELWVFPGISERKLQEYHGKIKNIPLSGYRFTTNVKEAQAKPIIAERARGFDFYAKILVDEFFLALQTPLPKFFTERGFTQASAAVAKEIDESRTMALQRLLKRVVENQLWIPVLKRAGFDPEQAKVRLNWGTPEKLRYEIADVLHAFELGAISQKETRKILIEAGWSLETQPENISSSKV
jgi:hypothetical protein